MSISVIIPTFNEEKHIQQAIDCVGFADEIIVIDSYSTDATIPIVKKNDCVFLQRKFDNFSNQKNFAIDRAKNDWIMILDADEFLLPKVQKEILNVLQQKEFVAYQIPRSNYFINRFLKFGTDRSERPIRIFDRNYCRYEGLVHEKLVCNGKIGTLKNPMLHYTYKSLDHFIYKKNKYAELQSQQLLEKNQKVNYFHIVIKPMFRFFNELLLRVGLFDGVPGITTTTMNAYGVLSRYIKLRTKQGKTKYEKLLDYDCYISALTNKAKNNSYQNKSKHSPGIRSFIFKPFFTFCYYYFIKLHILKGIDGYAYSYTQGFYAYQVLIYDWLRLRELE
ncbi:glycosyltransferase family 2 protein [Aquimarina sp. ERC-38]|uniref:glycosyltransferase family 2 protein n=1 Tax=Aquimarina sp. ERC-38 TaxID=2949996 RepID=UPI002246F7FA|nr:glycosyltransferase family 2 protein [Aquimarina sp. ERC-38]UZO80486.1 glycosyltransferase family 2 protein [Aquimarina sp. ERC-38]